MEQPQEIYCVTLDCTENPKLFAHLQTFLSKFDIGSELPQLEDSSKQKSINIEGISVIIQKATTQNLANAYSNSSLPLLYTFDPLTMGKAVIEKDGSYKIPLLRVFELNIRLFLAPKNIDEWNKPPSTSLEQSKRKTVIMPELVIPSQITESTSNFSKIKEVMHNCITKYLEDEKKWAISAYTLPNTIEIKKLRGDYITHPNTTISPDNAYQPKVKGGFGVGERRSATVIYLLEALVEALEKQNFASDFLKEATTKLAIAICCYSLLFCNKGKILKARLLEQLSEALKARKVAGIPFFKKEVADEAKIKELLLTEFKDLNLTEASLAEFAARIERITTVEINHDGTDPKSNSKEFYVRTFRTQLMHDINSFLMENARPSSLNAN